MPPDFGTRRIRRFDQRLEIGDLAVPTPIRLPAIASDFQAGTIAGWHKAVGDSVKRGEVLFGVETDKAVVEVEAEDDGVLGAIRVADGSEGVPVNTVLGFLLKHGETEVDIPDADVVPPQSSATRQQRPPDSARRPLQAPTSRTSGRIFASPLARRIAAQLGVDLSEINGRGPNGRILKSDVEAAAAQITIRPASATTQAPVRKRSGGLDIPNSKIRKVIAHRLTAAKQDIPHFYLTIDCELDALLNIRQQLNEHFASSGIKISVNDCVVKAVALALADVPAANVSWSEDAIHQYGTVDISVAVATANGLITPIVRDADVKPLSEISQEIKKLIARAIDGKLKPDEFNGGGFSVSNLGMYGIKDFSAIINPPQSCILAVGAGEKRPVVRGEKVAIATVMTCTLSVDHRSVDGAVGAELLSAFKKYIERPALLLLSEGTTERV